ncbi:SDR family NAD(P)-dependent oxidoreductase [Sphingomonas sp. ID0503]|uniref:SDR family NAD(P)-dependent oxidoreductase n=1 Tax=Sphingomonas sp. ID0503 TaxID=3399691 RepID=UPI003AFABC0F
MRFEGRTVIVTGAASAKGIGFASARRVVQEGGQVVLTDLDGEALAARVAEVEAMGGAALGVTHDVTDAAGWDAVLAQATARFGRVHGLVNNAGITVLAMVEALEPAMWHRQIEVNMTSVYLGCRLLIGHFRAHGGGSIVNVSSVAGLVGMRRCTAYSASKGGVRLMTKTLALECGTDGIRVNSVHPGVVETDIQKVARRDASGDSAAIAAAVPLGRTAVADELGAAVAFLLSDDASYVTGTELVVDGGLTAQ